MRSKEHFHYFHWLIPQAVATQVTGQLLHRAVLEKFIATLREALRKVELNLTFRNRDNVCTLSRNVFGRLQGV